MASPGQLGKLDQTLKTPRNLHRSPVERIVDPPCKRPNKMWKKNSKGPHREKICTSQWIRHLACDVIARRVKHKGSLTDGELSKSLTDHLKRSAALGDGNGNSKRSGQCRSRVSTSLGTRSKAWRVGPKPPRSVGLGSDGANSQAKAQAVDLEVKQSLLRDAVLQLHMAGTLYVGSKPRLAPASGSPPTAPDPKVSPKGYCKLPDEP